MWEGVDGGGRVGPRFVPLQDERRGVYETQTVRKGRMGWSVSSVSPNLADRRKRKGKDAQARAMTPYKAISMIPYRSKRARGEVSAHARTTA